VRTHVYIDAFNLYYGCLRNTPYRWLDILKLAQTLLPNDEIDAIKYFTARVSARPDDPDKPIRQQTYLRALRTLPNLSIIEGHFLTHVVSMRLADPIPGQSPYVRVIKTEEKGSDVNLAAHLLHDGHLDRYELAVVVSNDSDLLSPIQIVASELKLQVGLFNPHQHPSRELIEHALFVKNIRKGVLSMSQFPSHLSDEHGTFHKPPSW